MVTSRVQLCDIVRSHHLHTDVWDLAKYLLTEVTSHMFVRAVELEALSFDTMFAC